MLSKRDSTVLKIGLRKGFLTEDQLAEVMARVGSGGGGGGGGGGERPIEAVLEECGLLTADQRAEIVHSLADSGERKLVNASSLAGDLDRKLAELERAGSGRRSLPAAGDERRLSPGNIRNEGIDFKGYEFGAYRILDEVARGGMGVIFRAKQAPIQLERVGGLALPEEVALKVIITRSTAPAAAADIERFIREIRTLITVQHQNVVRIFDSGQEGGLYYYTMELVRGESLKELSARHRRLPLLLALEVVRRMASALDALHRAGILHRDVKPANILMDKAASPFRPVLIDFGLIKGKFAGPLTAGKGEVAGTPAYMSPEQTDATGSLGEVGPASDLYSLGAVLYFCLTGKSPFTGSKADEVIQAVKTRKPVPPSRLVPGIPPPVEAICLRCLEKRAQDRYPSMEALARDLDRELARGRRGLGLKNFYLKVRRKLLG